MRDSPNSPVIATESAPAPTALLDPAGDVATDLPCSCGYNLRTLAMTGLCPECAAPVREAIEQYRADTAGWLRGILDGLTFLRFVVLVHALLAVGLLLQSRVHIVSRGSRDLFAESIIGPMGAVAGIFSVLSLAILREVTAGPPGGVFSGGRRYWAGPVARWLCIAALCGAVPVLMLVPGAIAWHTADTIAALGATAAARLVRWVTAWLLVLYPAAAGLLFFSFRADCPWQVATVVFLAASSLGLIGLHTACKALRPHVHEASANDAVGQRSDSKRG